MNHINIKIRKKTAVADAGAVIVCGNSDYTVRFDFDDEWSGTGVKTARFTRENGGYTDVQFEGSEVAVPAISNTRMLYIGCYAGNIMTSTAAPVRAVPCCTDPAGQPEEPTPNVYAQLIERFDRQGRISIRSNGNWFFGSTDTGRPSRGERGEKGDKGDKGDPYGADYVCEAGTSGIWYYRKWASGRAECFGSIVCTGVSATEKWGSVYESASEYGGEAYPFAFAEPPLQMLYVEDAGAAYLIETQLNTQRHTAANTGKWYFWRPAESPGEVDVTVGICVFGRWKAD